MKRQPTKCKKIAANHLSDKGLIPQIYKELIQLNNKKQTIQLKKWVAVLNIFLQRRHTDGTQIHMNRRSTLLISEIQIKTKMRHRFRRVTMAITKKTRNNKR